MSMTMRYTDRRGNRQTLTFPQYVYLDTANGRAFNRGWGGLDSTVVVRLLADRGLLQLLDYPPYTPKNWRAGGVTKLGAEVLAAWKEKHA